MSDGSIDVLKDFDTVDFVASLNRLHIIGLSGHAVNCFENYLSGIAGNPLLFSQYWTMCPMVQYRGHFCSLSVVIFLHSVSLLDFFWHKGISVVFFFLIQILVQLLFRSVQSSFPCSDIFLLYSLAKYILVLLWPWSHFSPLFVTVYFFCYILFQFWGLIFESRFFQTHCTPVSSFSFSLTFYSSFPCRHCSPDWVIEFLPTFLPDQHVKFSLSDLLAWVSFLMFYSIFLIDTKYVLIQWMNRKRSQLFNWVIEDFLFFSRI